MQKQFDIAKKQFEAENEVQTVSEFDKLYQMDVTAHQALMSSRPWKKDPHYFKSVKVSTIALLKMVTHARSGGTIEIMGMLQGKVIENTFVIMDCYALPVEGTETRVNALNDANEYMVDYSELSKEVGRAENVVGWYHSHPGYGCWLSGIDCSTQMLNQQFQDPFLAMVVDPVRTMSAGKVEIGAFRTYPKDYRPPQEQASEYQSIPLDKIEDFGVHAKQYYTLDMSFFKSPLDAQMLNLLWDKYWINTLASSPLVANRVYTNGVIRDIAKKVEAANSGTAHTQRMSIGVFSLDREKKESKLSKLRKDSSRTAVASLENVLSEAVKDSLFNQRQS